MQNTKLPHRKDRGEQAICYRLFFFNVSFSFSCFPSYAYLHHFSGTALAGFSFSSCLSAAIHYFLTVPERAWAGGGGEADEPSPHVSALFKQFGKSGVGGGRTAAHTIPITLNVINLPDSWKSDMHELQRNLLFRHEMLLHNEKENVLCALINSDRSSTPKYFYLWHYLFRP